MPGVARALKIKEKGERMERLVAQDRLRNESRSRERVQVIDNRIVRVRALSSFD